MATPDRILPNLSQAVADLQKRVTYIDQKSTQSRLVTQALIDSVSGGGLTSSPVVKRTVTFTVPAGCTSAMITATASAQVKNTNGVSGNLRVKPNINGTDGYFPLRLIQAGTTDSVAETMNLFIPDLITGQTIDVQVLSWVDGVSWTADAGNSFAIRAAAWFMR